jgi:hypothetical protein
MRHLVLFPKAEPGFEVSCILDEQLNLSMVFSCSTAKPIPVFEFINPTGEEFKKDFSGLSMQFSYSIP